MFNKKYLFIISLFFVSACSSRNNDESHFLEEGALLKKQLTEELLQINTVEDLLSRKKKLILLFTEIAYLQKEALTFQSTQNMHWEVPYEEEQSSQILYEELKRLAVIPGAVSVLESCQMKAREILHDYEKKESVR